jgi:transcriptional regulator with XRE-family HTH domain
LDYKIDKMNQAVAGSAIGRRIRACRVAARYSQRATAAALRVQQQTVSGWEQGLHYPLTAQWIEMAILYGASLDYLMLGVRTIPAAHLVGACSGESEMMAMLARRGVNSGFSALPR